MPSSGEARGQEGLRHRRLPRFRLGADDDHGENEHAHPGQSLEGVVPVLGLYYRALSARNAAILPDDSAREEGERYADTHTTLRLPGRVAIFHAPSANFGW